RRRSVLPTNTTSRVADRSASRPSSARSPPDCGDGSGSITRPRVEAGGRTSSRRPTADWRAGSSPSRNRAAGGGPPGTGPPRRSQVSLVDDPAYADARVLAVRSALPDVSELLAVTYDLADLAEPPDLARLVFGVRS